MPEIISLGAESRASVGKGAARAARRAGRVPGIIYGDDKEPTPISLDPRELSRAISRAGFFATLVDVTVDGSVHRTLAREVQYHPVSDAALHVDFMRVGADATVHVSVPVRFVNQERSPGMRRGGILNVVRHSIDIACRVDAIPEGLTLSLEGLEVGDSIHAEQLTLPEGVRVMLGSRDSTIASIAASSAVREEALAAAATPEDEGAAAAEA